MNVDISKIMNENAGSINFEGEVKIPEELIKTTEIKKLKIVFVSGEIIDAH